MSDDEIAGSLSGVPVRSVARAIDVLLSLTDGPQPLHLIAESARLPKPTIHRLLASLSHRHMVIQEPETGRYALGAGCLSILSAVTRGAMGFGVQARPILEDLRERTGETVTIHIVIRNQRVCILELPSLHQVRYAAEVGATAPLHVGSAGKVLLAFMSEAQREAVLSTLKLSRVTDNTVTSLTSLIDEMDAIRRCGYGISRGERVPGASAASAPILDANGGLVASLSALGPDSRLDEGNLRELAVAVVHGAQAVSAQLGGSIP